MQRGRLAATLGPNERKLLTAEISPVDTSKSIFFVTSAGTQGGSGVFERATDVTVSNFDGNSISMYLRSIDMSSSTASMQAVADWQVIEFY